MDDDLVYLLAVAAIITIYAIVIGLLPKKEATIATAPAQYVICVTATPEQPR